MKPERNTMAGIYIHIPFCRQICYYCDFHKSASMSLKDELFKALLSEIALQQDYLGDEIIDTVYFGGGTPSILSAKESQKIYEKLNVFFTLSGGLEITLEANPDDLDDKYLKQLSNTPINRLSIGCQSFNNRDLVFLNRRHTAEQAQESVRKAKKVGFNNISIDLIYGIPNLSVSDLERNIQTAVELDVQHISAYHLTIEEKTVFHKRQAKGEFEEISEEESNTQFQLLIKKLAENGFEQYEISNFARNKNYSRHNTNYWKQIPYLGIGPSAHSYNTTSRQWNISNNKTYIAEIRKGKIPFSKEIIDKKTKYNDYILSSLRTMWGINLLVLEEQYSKEMKDYCMSMAEKFINYGLLAVKNNSLIITDQGKFVSDNIISELLFVDT